LDLDRVFTEQNELSSRRLAALAVVSIFKHEISGDFWKKFKITLVYEVEERDPANSKML
jgi:hypothetical protein